MRIKLLASTAAPTSISNLSRPLARHRFIPRPRNNTEMRPSILSPRTNVKPAPQAGHFTPGASG
jgi:hypothetical protein